MKRSRGKAAVKCAINERQALSMYLRGMTQTEIAKELGVGQPTVSMTLKRLRERTLDSITRDMDGYLCEMTDRTMTALRALAPAVELGDPDAIRTQNQTIERLSKLLGLDRAKSQDETVAALAGQMVAAAEEARRMLTAKLGDG